MKRIRFFSLFLAVLLLLCGCSSTTDRDIAVSSSALTTTEAVAVSTTAVATSETSAVQTETTVTTTQPQTTTAQVSASASQVYLSSSAATTIAVTSSTTQAQTEASTKSLWSIFGGNSNKDNKNSATAKTNDNNRSTCFVSIRCETIKDNLSSLKKGKEAFVPKSGVILDQTEVSFQNGESAFDVMKRACSENVCTDNCKYCQKSGIQLEYNFTPAFGTYYIEGIHQLYEKDCGSMSGWMFSVNGNFPTDGSSSYTVKPGDEIVFAYTCDMGDDIGNAY